ncbi:VirB4-like conjugal transfer ATPase, CD1110 family [Ellagibacter isourolithinifaciens]|uniref:VirB4-like conjugal transfer ATPase, CD1110 family n=1 Tax=Ellagibacter isourolithinifaciens TaxID=2137581 RepID=UPI0023F1C6E8|nr:conjugal transfer protein TraC [Ellagibacter isourolithinifaciens]MDD5925518.1 conjugal transfer protein TraC [Ellagibacter isourolithinifaciens]
MAKQARTGTKRSGLKALVFGAGGGSANQEKKSKKQERRQRQKEVRRAKDASSCIGYDLLFEDGICQVAPGIYSQTVEFSDISYQSAREDTQNSIFAAMRGLYNTFRSDSHIQLTVSNVPIPIEIIGNKVFFEQGQLGCDTLVSEYNRILNDKMREGCSNLKRHRYLSYSVEAASLDAAVPKLARIRNDVIQTLNGVRCEARSLDGTERLEAINEQTRPGRKLLFSWDNLSPKSPCRTKDFVTPAYYDFHPDGRNDCFESEGCYGQILSIRTFGSMLEDTFLADIINLPIPLTVSVHAQPIELSEAKAMVERQISWIDKEIHDEQVKAATKGYSGILSPELRFSKDEAEELLDFIVRKNEHLFVYSGLVYVYADSLEALDRNADQVISAAQGSSVGIEPLYYRQREALSSILPLAHPDMITERYLTTGQVVMQMPFGSQELDQEGGGYYGQSKQSGNLVICNRTLLASPMGFVFGKPGSGKSFAVKREITNTRLAHPTDEIFVFDPAGEYGNLVDALGGVNYSFAPGTGTYLNPFDLADVSDKSNDVQLAFKIDAFLALSAALMAEGSEGLPEADRSIITRCVRMSYAASEGIPPTLGDFHSFLLAQPEPEARDIALRYERYVEGPMSFFNHQSNMDFDVNLTNIDLHELSQNMRVFGMLTALEMVRNRLKRNKELGIRTWVYIDEVQGMFGHPAIINYFSKFYAEGRKDNLICTGISQNATALLAHESARTMVMNCDFVLLFKQAAQDLAVWAETLALSSAECGYIDNTVRPGEGMILAGSVRVPIRDDFPKGRLYHLWNTKPSEIAEINRAKALKDGQA